MHQEKSDEVIDGLQLVFIELPKFQPQTFSEKVGVRETNECLVEGDQMQVLWLRFLTEINENTLEAPNELLENPDVSEALKIVEVAAYTPEEMRAYDKFWDAISTRKTEILDYELKLEQAKAEAEDAKEKMLDAARTMKADGMSVDLIAKYTGLSNEQIEAL